jgi:hypothetical protein
MSKLTIGILTCNDHDGLYFSLQAIRLYHPEVLDEIEFLVLDNDPESPHGKANERFVENWLHAKYVKITDAKGTGLRDRIFKMAETPYVMSMDCHVMFVPGSLRKLIDFFDQGEDNGWLIQGPLLYDDGHSVSTHFDLEWRAQMWGTWGTDDRGKKPDYPPFEIPAQGLGVFACRKDAWLGFHPGFRGFGGEEGYIHTKYKQAGKGTLCLPFLRWIHRFERPNGVPYPLDIVDRVTNYMIGFNELGLDVIPIREHFKDILTSEQWAKVDENAAKYAPPGLPPLHRQALGLVKAAVAEGRAMANGVAAVTPEQKQERLSICAQCEFLLCGNGDGTGDRCGQCGCYLNAKANWRSQACPIGKWLALT